MEDLTLFLVDLVLWRWSQQTINLFLSLVDSSSTTLDVESKNDSCIRPSCKRKARPHLRCCSRTKLSGPEGLEGNIRKISNIRRKLARYRPKRQRKKFMQKTERQAGSSQKT